MLDTLKNEHINIKSLNFSNNFIDDDFIPSLGEFIKSNPNFESFSLGVDRYASEGKGITNHGIVVLSECLVGNTSLKSIDIYGQAKVNDEAFPILKDIIKNTRIQTLGVSNTSIKQAGELHRLLTQNVFQYGHEEISILFLYVLSFVTALVE